MIDEAELKSLAPKRSRRARWPTGFYQPALDYVNYMEAGEPSSYEEATVTPDTDAWPQAMRSEMDSIHHNQTWELVDLPARRKLANGSSDTSIYLIPRSPNTKLNS